MEKEYQLHISITKALSPSEAPLKVKHARSVIIATHRSKSAKPFWTVITRQPIMEHRFTAWKFCHLLHKVLREGHESVVKQSQTHKTLILEVGKMWGHLQDGVGKCIEVYTRLLVNKLEFHQKNANIPGSLAVDFSAFARSVGDDLNIYFQLCVEVFDYIEHILHAQAQIFLAINTYRLSSMTPQGQCRLAPLITLIQDSNPLYDICVRIMFRLHDGLPHDVLMGHRNRFNEIFKKLKSFYENVRPLQYFSDVIQLPHLPDVVPNFSSELDLGNYTAPVMVLQQEPETEPIESLVDLANASDVNSQLENVLEEKELIIRQLTEALNEKQMALEHYSNLPHQMNNYQLKNDALEQELSKVKEMLQSALRTKTTLEQKLLEMSNIMEQKVSKMSIMEKEVQQSEGKIKNVEEKFDKIKTMYTKLREEHISLLRMRNEDSKHLASEKNEVQQLKEEIANLNDRLAQSEKAELLNSSLQSKSLEFEEILANKEGYIENLNTEMVKLKEQVQKIKKEHMVLVQQFEEQNSKVEEANHLLFMEKQDKQQLEIEIQDLRGKLEHQILKSEEIDCALKAKSQGYESVIASKEHDIEQLNSELSIHKEQLLKSNLERSDLIKKYDEEIKIHDANSQYLLQNSQKDCEEKQQQLEKLLNIQSNNEAALREFEQKLNCTIAGKHNVELALKLAKEQCEILKKSETEAVVAADNIISAAIKAIKHSFETSLANTVFDPSLVLQQCRENIAAISVHLQNVLDSYKLHISSNVALSEDYVTSSILLFTALRSLQEYIIFVVENTTDMENAKILRSFFDEVRNYFVTLYQMLLERGKDIGVLEKHCHDIDRAFADIRKLLLLMSNSFTENLNIGDLLQKELKDMDKMIEEAAQKMLEIQRNSKSKNEGIKLEVNEKILDSCTNLMKCIINLIKKSRDLQNEIVARGKGTFTEKEFYKRNSQWTEGLISASKSVAKGANYLVDAANKAIVLESNECFEIIVAAQEIAASTAQLVIASKVKANKDSQKLIDLTKASRDVSLATGSVVATVKDGCNTLEYKNEIDMTKLTTSQKKAMEMEMHIKVLQLEQALDNERQNLMSFRKKFYQSEDD